ncbi:hypothetical protein [Streptomyces marianii]|uniref:Uncharacterized protein n=1 Tax=Streptomyces marianii TaxID=1817406 RepID=A0A5R9DSU7_9ACTN|nr:hypothetical protein [Streptomyces marianii]TLQ39195.1 hypothetical protein FEF34_37985 [Streptomyces marianii]
MPLSRRDFKLSMAISPMKRNGPETEALRSLLVHRLRDARMAIARLPLKANLATAGLKKYSVHCEPCRSWFDLPEWGEEFTCPKCRQLYALELAVFSAVPDERA